jgi:hypothetical protein
MYDGNLKLFAHIHDNGRQPSLSQHLMNFNLLIPQIPPTQVLIPAAFPLQLATGKSPLAQLPSIRR